MSWSGRPLFRIVTFLHDTIPCRFNLIHHIFIGGEYLLITRITMFCAIASLDPILVKIRSVSSDVESFNEGKKRFYTNLG
jgi:hypothetical protein